MKIFHIEGSAVKPTEEILLISPFKEIWERDATNKKEMASRELAYIEFMVSPRKSNPFAGYPDSEKSDKIIEGLWKEEKWSPDDLVKDAIDIYFKWTEEASPSWRYYLAVRKSVENTRKFLETVDLQERNEKGMPVYKPSDVINTLTKANEILKNLQQLEERVEQELFESSKTMSGKEINDHFER